MEVARTDLSPGVGDADNGFLQVLSRESDSVQHRPRRGTAGPFRDYRAALSILGDHVHLGTSGPISDMCKFEATLQSLLFNANATISQIYNCYLLIRFNYKDAPAYLEPGSNGEKLCAAKWKERGG